MTDKWIFWFNELGKEQNEIVGKKCANLGEMTKIGMPVPMGFALSVGAMKMFLEKSGAEAEIKKYLEKYGKVEGIDAFNEVSAGLRKITDNKKIPKEMNDVILANYDKMCQELGPDVAVSVRSAGTVSHPGQYETYLNVKGKAELEQKIIRVWSSIYNARTIAALVHKGQPVYESPLIGVAVLQLIHARCAGVGFTCDPVSGDPSKITIEGNWGFGESVVAGIMTPDRWVVDRGTLTIITRAVREKPTQIVSTDKGVVEKELPKDKQAQPCLSDEEIIRVAKAALKLEEHWDIPQDMEWAVTDEFPAPNNLFMLQTRPVAGVKKTIKAESATSRSIDEIIKSTFNIK
jgi:pyruvate, water dikinase